MVDGPWKYDPDADRPQGVWVVWSTSTRESVCGIWSEEIEALRFVNKSGYGTAEFIEFGELS